MWQKFWLTKRRLPPWYLILPLFDFPTSFWNFDHLPIYLLVVCSLWQSECIWLDVEEETSASSNWIGCNFKPFRGQTFVASTKNDQLCDPQPPHPQNWIIDLLLKNKKKSTNTWQILRPPTPLPCGHHKCMVPYVFTVIWIFFCFKKNYEDSQSSKYCLKTLISPKIVDLHSK